MLPFYRDGTANRCISSTKQVPKLAYISLAVRDLTRVEEAMLVQQPIFANNRRSLVGGTSQAQLHGVNRPFVFSVGRKNDIMFRIDNGLKLLDHVKIRKWSSTINHLVKDTT